MDYISSLKVKGLVIGPLHVNLDDSQSGTNLQAIDPRFGNLEQFQEVLQAAKKKSKAVWGGQEGKGILSLPGDQLLLLPRCP